MMLVNVQLHLPTDTRFVSMMRNLAGSVLNDLGAPQEAADDIRLAVSEACANVVRHAVSSNAYTVTLSVSENGCEVQVRDRGPGFTPPTMPSLDPENESGRGIALMRALMDDLEFLPLGEGTGVRLYKRWKAVPLDDGDADGDADGRRVTVAE